MRWLLPAVIAFPAWAQPAWVVDRIEDARTPEELIAVVNDWQRGEQVATIYAHSQYDGSNGTADGTATKPYTTIAAVDAAMGNDDTIILGGTFREAWTLNHTGVTVRKFTDDEWADVPGATTGAYIIRGDVISTDWSAHGTYTNTYVASTNAASAEPASVVINWDDNAWSDGRHPGHLQEAASAAACNTTAGTWFWNTTELLVNPPSGVTLNNETVAWCRTGQGIELSGDDCTIQDGLFYLWCDSAASSGYSIRGAAVSGCSIVRCQAWDTGYHGFGFAVGKCADNAITDCTVTSGNHTCDSYFVFFSSSGSLSGCVGSGNLANMSPLLKYGATEGGESYSDYITSDAGAAPDQVAFTQHTGSSQTIAAGGVKWQNCAARKLSADSTSYKVTAAANGQDGVEPSDKWDSSTYPVQWIDCDLEGDWLNLGQGPSTSDFSAAHAFVRTKINCASTVNSSVNGSATPNCIYNNRIWLLMESCTLYGETSNATSAGLIRIRGTTNDNDNLYLSSTSMYATGSTIAFINRVAATNHVAARHSVFASDNASVVLFWGNTTADAADYTFSKCWYDTNIVTFGRGAAYDTQAEWEAAVDAGGTYGVDFSGQLLDTVTMEPVRTSALALTRDINGNADTPVGINRKPYVGNAGAWQMPHNPSVAGSTSTRRRTNMLKSRRSIAQLP